MQNNSRELDDSREPIAYQRLPVSSESSIERSNDCISSRDSNRSDSPFVAFEMNESKYSKVIFSEISESYPTDADIECRFYIGEAVKPLDSDKICLFRVGWVNVLECLVVKNVSESETDNEFGEKKVKFDASLLPKHTEEFFQFCYLTENDDICGASTPFRFIRPHEDDLIQLDNRNSDEEDFVVVRSQQALLQERLQHLANENGVLEYSKRSIEQQMASKVSENNELRKMNVDIEDRIKLTQLESNRLSDKLKTSEEQNSVKSKRIEALELDLAQMKQIKDDFQNQLESNQSEMSKLEEVVKTLEMNSIKNDNILKSRDQELMQLVKKNAEQQVLIDELNSSKAIFEAKLELSSASIAKVMSERRDFDSENKMLRNTLEDMKAKNDSLESKTELMMTEILDFEKMKLKSKVQMKTMIEEMEDLKLKLDQTESDHKTVTHEKEVIQKTLEKQLQEMKSRLSNASEEYQKLFKYNTKLENRIERIKAKVKKYFDTKSQTKAAINVSLTERQELLARAETEVKTVIETESESALPPSPSKAPEENCESIRLTQMPCILCNEEITCMSRDSKPMVQHLEDKHLQRLCPICSQPFDTTIPDYSKYLQMHVDNHFHNNYPQASAPPPMIP